MSRPVINTVVIGLALAVVLVAALPARRRWAIQGGHRCVSDGVNFLGCNPDGSWTDVSRVDPASGALLWNASGSAFGRASFLFCPQQPHRAFLVDGDASSASSNFTMVDRATGRRLWSFVWTPVWRPWQVACSFDGSIIFVPVGATLLALNATSGSNLWLVMLRPDSAFEPLVSFTEVRDDGDDDSAVNATSSVFVYSNYGSTEVLRLNSRTGAREPFDNASVTSAPYAAAGSLAICNGLATDTVVAVMSNGTLVWSTTAGILVGQSGRGILLFQNSSTPSTYSGVNASTGSLLWRFEGDAYVTGANADVIVLMSSRLANGNYNFHGRSYSTGALLWSLPNVSNYRFEPTFTENYFAVYDGGHHGVTVIRMADGSNRTLPIAEPGVRVHLTETRELLVSQDLDTTYIAEAFEKW